MMLFAQQVTAHALTAAVARGAYGKRLASVFHVVASPELLYSVWSGQPPPY